MFLPSFLCGICKKQWLMRLKWNWQVSVVTRDWHNKHYPKTSVSNLVSRDWLQSSQYLQVVDRGSCPALFDLGNWGRLHLVLHLDDNIYITAIYILDGCFISKLILTDLLNYLSTNDWRLSFPEVKLIHGLN